MLRAHNHFPEMNRLQAEMQTAVDMEEGKLNPFRFHLLLTSIKIFQIQN